MKGFIATGDAFSGREFCNLDDAAKCDLFCTTHSGRMSEGCSGAWPKGFPFGTPVLPGNSK